jgi:tether containing UBX domain for GLUT4
MFRFAGLPNNSCLEMVESDQKRVEQSLVICVQLEDGTRLNGNFESSATLKHIISTLCPDMIRDNQSPVVIYMRSELHGDALDTVTLKSLGLTSGGRALLRLINTDPENLKVQANISTPLPQKPKEEIEEKPRNRTNVETAGTSFQLTDVKKLKEEAIKVQVVNQEPMDVQEDQMEVEDESNQVEDSSLEEQKAPMVEEAVEVLSSEAEPVINYLDDRGTIIFSLDSMEKSSVDLPDSFFDLTESEVRLLYRDLKKQVDENDNKPLMTASLRKLEENKKILNQLSIYKSCAVRIQMPNRYVIQTRFSTVETIGQVHDFIRKFLINPDVDFHLCE